MSKLLPLLTADLVAMSSPERLTLVRAGLIGARFLQTYRAAELTTVDLTGSLLQIVAVKAFMAEAPPSSFFESLPGGYDAARKQFFTNGPRFAEALARRVVVDSFQNLEFFVRESFLVLFVAFPHFLTGSREARALPDVLVDDLFGDLTLPQARAAIALRRIDALLQADSLVEALGKLGKRFGLSFPLTPEDQHALVELAPTRNVYVHAEGVVNERFLALLHRHRVPHSYSLDDSLPQRRIARRMRGA